MKRLLVLLLGSTLASGLFAAETEMDRLRAALAERLPNVTPDRLAPSPVPGLYELVVGTQVVYITPDARLALQGRLLDLEQGTDLTEPVVSAARLELLAALPEEQRVAVYLADVEGFAYREIADIMGSPVGTVMSRLHRGRSALRASLADYATRSGMVTTSHVREDGSDAEVRA